MTCTDDDLKRLKAHNSSASDATDYAVPQCTIPCGIVNALIARLEAAEKVIATAPRGWLNSEYLEAWRKAAGK